MFNMDLLINLDLMWSSDWMGEEVGYPDVIIVGLYTYQPNVGPEISLYIDIENGIVLDMWSSCDCD